MGLICKISGHKWNGCTCTRCDITRDEGHHWINEAGKCVKVCTICGKKRAVPHTWNGCKCAVCGALRDEGHQWREKPGECREVCTISIPGVCREACVVCGEERPMEHDFKNGYCSRCGMTENEAYMALALNTSAQAEALRYVAKISDPQMIRAFIQQKQGLYVCLCSLDYISDDEVLNAIARDKGLDYELRCKARQKIKNETLRQSLEIEEDPVYRAMYDADIKSGM